MKRASWLGIGLLAFSAAHGWVLAGENTSSEDRKFTGSGQIALPQDYREWVYLSSGLGMTYGPAASANSEHQNFDNVFVTRRAYQSFQQTGIWPDKTMFILEVRSSRTNGSINRGGHYQGEIMAIEGEMKDETNAQGKWTFFSFDLDKAAGTPFPRTAACYSCHSQHGAVDNTFVQFYPTLLPIALKKGTVKPEGLRAKP